MRSDVIDHTGMAPYYQDVDDHQAYKILKRSYLLMKPFIGFPAVATWTLYRAMRGAGVRVCFDGEGSDGLLGSSPDYIMAELEQAVIRLDLRRYFELRRVLRGLVGGNFNIDRATILGELRWFAQAGLKRLQLLDPTPQSRSVAAGATASHFRW